MLWTSEVSTKNFQLLNSLYFKVITATYSTKWGKIHVQYIGHRVDKVTIEHCHI